LSLKYRLDVSLRENSNSFVRPCASTRTHACMWARVCVCVGARVVCVFTVEARGH